jgi:hypothetical protein
MAEFSLGSQPARYIMNAQAIGKFALLIACLVVSCHRPSAHVEAAPIFWTVHCVHLTLGGMGLGILISLAISPEFYRRHDREAYV